MASNLDMGRYVPLKTVCSYFLDNYDRNPAEMDKVWIIAHRALAKLNRSFAQLPKTARILVNANFTVDLPKDYKAWSKIGIMDDNGQYNTLKINNAISYIRDTSPNRLNYITPDVNTSIGAMALAPFFFNMYTNSTFYNAPIFGAQPNLIQYGQCTVDETNNVIILPSDFKYTSILLEYLSVPQRDGDYQVEEYLQEAIIAFIEWKLNVGSRENFYAHAVEARRSTPGKRVNMQTIHQMIRETNGFYLKS